MPVAPMRVLRQTIIARIANHVDTAPDFRSTGLPWLPLLNGLSAVAKKSAKSSGVKVLLVWWSSVSLQAVSIFRHSTIAIHFCRSGRRFCKRTKLNFQHAVQALDQRGVLSVGVSGAA